MKKILAAVSVALAGCGGGGTTDTSNSVTVKTTVENLPLFSSTPIELPDLRPLYDSLCGNLTNISREVVLVDLNNDGNKDIALQFFCGRNSVDQTGKPYDGPSPNKFVVFLQQKNGTFVDGTRTLFGVDYVDLGGLVTRSVVSDFNKDGYPDIVFSLSKEDGRLPNNDGATNINAQNMFITSNGRGGYNFIKQGQLAWNYGLITADNELGGTDVISSPIGYNYVQEVWRYISSWSLTGFYNWVNGSGTTFFKRKSSTQGSQIAVTGLPYPDSGLALYYKENGAWVKKDSLPNKTSMVFFGSWTGTVDYTPMTTIDGKDYIPFSQLEGMCEIKLKKDDPDSILLDLVQGSEIKGGYHGQTIYENGDYLQGKSWLLAYNVTNGKLTRNTTFKINNETQNLAASDLKCKDVDGDGYDDIIMTAYFGPPLIYINDKTGTFNRIDSANIPNIGYYTHGESYIYEDINGDGVPDIVRFPVNNTQASNAEQGPLKFKIYTGNRPILSKDLLK
jgi:hypothetical protein